MTDPETDPEPAAGRRRSRLELWAPVLVLVVVAAVVWVSFWSDTAVTDVAGDRESRATTVSDGTTGTDDAGDEADDEADGDADDAAGSPGAEPRHQEQEQLEESVRRFRAAQRRLAARVSRQVKVAERRNQTLEFQVASFNVLGDSHTGPGGNKPGYPDGSPRMDLAISTLRSNGIDVVGFQEFEQSQYSMFTARAGEYSLYPGMTLGNKSVRFNIAWRSDMFRMVDAHTLSIPYAGGSRIAMPVVLLESTSTGRRAWFANFHNPADTARLGSNGRWRAEAAAIEVSHLTQLHQSEGLPVIATGDYNEREAIFCRFAATGVFTAAAGGSGVGGCSPPPRMGVDWIFGSAGVAFTGYAVTDTGNASDHAMVHSTATLTSDGVLDDPDGEDETDE